MSGDTAEMDVFWDALNAENNLDALLIECAFPDGLDDVAQSSHHLTPKKLQRELKKFKHESCPVYVINLKPMYQEKIISELKMLEIDNLQILQIGEIYEF